MDEKMEKTGILRADAAPTTALPDIGAASDAARATPDAEKAASKRRPALPWKRGGDRKPKKKLSAAERKKRRRIVRIAIVILVLAGGGFWAYRRFFAGRGASGQAMPLTDFVQYGAITATVEGSGMTRAKNSENMVIAYNGTVKEVLVEEGDVVTTGQALYVIDSEDARQAVESAEKGVTDAREAVDRAKEGVRSAEENVRSAEEGVATARERVTAAQEEVVTAQERVKTAQEGVTSAEKDVVSAQERVDSAKKDLEKIRAKLDDLQVKAAYTGKALDVAKLNPGDKLSEGTKVATLVDDTRFRLTQYYSYAYAGEIKAGQTARVSVPSLMSELSGVVETVHMISRPTTEGSQLFSAEIVVENDGALAADMTASAAVDIGDEYAAPYDSGKLEYYRTSDLKTEVGGTVIESTLVDYLPVREGQVVVILDSDTLDDQISDAQKVVEDREKDVEDRVKAVDAAKKGVTDAERGVETARKGVTDAEDGVTTALRGVETAKKGVTEAEKTVTENEKAVEEAQNKVLKAQEELVKCNAVAPIDGKVIGLNLTQGEEVPANTVAMVISDMSTMIVNATVDSRNISYVKKGLAVELNQWDQAFATGYVESVSLSSTSANGVTTYPMVIAVDSPDENFQVNSDVRYTLVASQNDNCLLVPIQCVRNASTEDGESVTVVYVGGERPDNAIDGVIAIEDIPEGFWPVPVEIGIQDSYSVEIKSGLTEGQEVFTQMQEEDYAFSMF
ncbi:MAG: HlyD family efflux transporter periplasmic adaptor subunit [Oscillibacter sp.]|nr:HlyD family efflux transporter periplasmic adaptor subunit [Oscillibacter sp.]